MKSLFRFKRTIVTLAAVAVLVPFSAQPRVQAQSQDIVDTAVAAGSFKTLAAALKAAGLIDTLKGKGPFTVFAPTDDAFAKLPAGTVEDLLKPENKAKLTAILTYHVVAGKVMAGDVVKLKHAATVIKSGEDGKLLAAGCVGGPHEIGTRSTFGDLGATVADLLGAEVEVEGLVGESFAHRLGFQRA